MKEKIKITTTEKPLPKGQSNIGQTNEMPDFLEQVKQEIEKNKEFRDKVINGFKKKNLSKKRKKLMEETFGIKL